MIKFIEKFSGQSLNIDLNKWEDISFEIGEEIDAIIGSSNPDDADIHCFNPRMNILSVPWHKITIDGMPASYDPHDNFI